MGSTFRHILWIISKFFPCCCSFPRASVLQEARGTSSYWVSLGISVHCLAVFCLCHLHRFPSGHRQHFLLLMQIEIIQLQIGTHAQLNFSTFETDASPASVPCVDEGWLLPNSGQAHNSLFFCQSTSYLLLTNVTGFPGELDPLPIAMLSMTSLMLTATCHFCLLCLWETLLIC